MKKVTLMLMLVAGSSIAFAQSLRNGNYNQLKPVAVQNSAPVIVTSNASRTSVAAKSQILNFSGKGGAASSNAVLFTDDFNTTNDTGSLVSRGYLYYFNGTGPAGILPAWIQGDDAVFASYNGNPDGYVASSYNSVTATNDVDNWLVLPALNIATGDTISFWSQAPLNSTYPDSIKVMYSAVGDSTPGASSWVLLGDFEVNTGGAWLQSFFSAPSAGATARFAIRHAVVDGGPTGLNSDYIGIDQLDVFQANTTTGGTGLVNDDCAGALDLNASLGQAVGVVTTTGPYNNDSATVGSTDPTTGFACWGEPDGAGANPTIDNSIWFTFTGDGNTYFIETGNCGGGLPNAIDDGDTQIAIYDGTCGALNPVACNEDGPSATATYYPAGLNFPTVSGTVYYMMIDGFNFNGALSNGQFCVNISKLATVACSAATPGVATVNDSIVCYNDTLQATVTGAIAPTITGAGIYSGFSWLISTADITGSTDPLNEPSFVGGSGIAAGGQNIALINTGTPFAAGIYYFTPCVYGNAAGAAPVYVFDLTLDPACTYSGTSVMVNLLAQGDPLCVVGINENHTAYGISNLYPVPVKDMLNFNIDAQDKSSVEVTIKDVVGKVVYSGMKNVTPGSNKVSVSMKKQTAGVYFITLKSGSTISTEKFVKE